MTKKICDDLHAVMAVRVCPERDIECGGNAAAWCVMCPKKIAPPVAEAIPAQSDLIWKLESVLKWINRFPIPTRGATAMMCQIREVQDFIAAKLPAQDIPAQAAASIDTPEFQDLIDAVIERKTYEARTFIVAHINAAMTAYGQQQRQEGRRDAHETNVTLLLERDKMRECAATAQGMADCMDMVRQELVDAGIIGADIAPMFIANAVVAWGASLRERAEKAETELAKHIEIERLHMELERQLATRRATFNGKI